MQLWSDEEDAEQCFPGANVKLKLKNVEEEDVSGGFVLCSPDNLCHTGRLFDAQVTLVQVAVACISVELFAGCHSRT